MISRGLTSFNKLELRVYHIIGINQFRKIILWFEKIKHYRDGCKNENYHPANFNVFSFEQYNGFLLYNAFLHILSLLFTLAYVVLSTVIEFRNIVFDLSLVFITILNIYCIILQRTNYLRIKERCYKYYKRFLGRTDLYKRQALEKIYDREPHKLQADYEVISRIKKAFDGQTDCVLSRTDIESLKRFCVCFDFTRINKVGRKNKKISEVGLIEKCNSASGLYTKVQIRADLLQRKLGISGRKILNHTAIITADLECEKLYKELFPEDTAYVFCAVCILLYEIFTDMISKVCTNEV